MNYSPIRELISAKITGEWGKEPSSNPVKIIRTTNFNNNGKLNISNVVEREVDERSIKNKQLKKGDVIIEKSGGSPTQPVGRVVYFDVDDGNTYLCNNFTSILRPSSTILPKYLFFALYYLHLIKRTLKYQNKTTGIINLQLDRYINTEKIIIPNIEKQKNIVKILDQVDTLRHKRKQAIGLLDEYIKSVFLDMFGDPIKSDHNWKIEKLGNLLLNIDSGWSPKCLDKKASPNSWGVLKLSAITNCKYNETHNKQLPDNLNPKLKNEVKSGDVLFSRKNTYELIGATALVFNTRPKLMISDLIFRLNIKDTSILKPEFLWKLLISSRKRIEIQSLAGGASGSMPNISKEKLKNISIPVPPITLQNKFADIVQETEKIKQKMLNQSVELENQFQALMQKCFFPN